MRVRVQALGVHLTILVDHVLEIFCIESQLKKLLQQMPPDVWPQHLMRNVGTPACGEHRKNRPADVELRIEQSAVHVEQVHRKGRNHLKRKPCEKKGCG